MSTSGSGRNGTLMRAVEGLTNCTLRLGGRQ
jgi:hypothetical protein